MDGAPNVMGGVNAVQSTAGIAAGTYFGADAR